jgi:hypothetical protein
MRKLSAVALLSLCAVVSLSAQTVILPKTTVLAKTAVIGAAGGGTNPTFETDVTNSSFCQNVATCAASAFTPITGDLILAFEYAGGTSGAYSAPTDTCGTSGGASNTYTLVASNSSSWKSGLYWAIVGYGKSCVVTGNFTAVSGVNEQIYVQDWRGVNATTPVYTAAIGNVNTPGTGANAVSSSLGTGSTISGTQTNNDIAGGVITCYGNADTFSAGTGYTLGGIHENVGNCNVAGEYEALSAAASGVSATFTTTGGTNNYYHTFAAVIQHP